MHYCEPSESEGNGVLEKWNDLLEVTHLVNGLQTLRLNLFPLCQMVDRQREKILRQKRAASFSKWVHQKFEMVIQALIYKIKLILTPQMW